MLFSRIRYAWMVRYTIADMAIWPWMGWLVDGKIYGEAGEFLQVKDSLFQ